MKKRVCSFIYVGGVLTFCSLATLEKVGKLMDKMMFEHYDESEFRRVSCDNLTIDGLIGLHSNRVSAITLNGEVIECSLNYDPSIDDKLIQLKASVDEDDMFPRIYEKVVFEEIDNLLLKPV